MHKTLCSDLDRLAVFPRARTAKLQIAGVSLLILVSLGACHRHARDGVPGIKAASPRCPRVLRDDECIRLIEALADDNPAPRIGNDGEPVFEASFRWSEYDRANAAIESLALHAEEAWPALIRSFHDRRYCTTAYGDSSDNYSVGEICQFIVRRWLAEAYMQHSMKLFAVKPPPPAPEMLFNAIQYPEFLRSTNELERWCTGRRDKHLSELQAEMCEWAIKTIGGFRAIDDNQRRPFIEAVRAQVQELHASGRAVTFSGFRHDERFRRYHAGWGAVSGAGKGDH
jgi:hypothetical protein